MRINYDGDMDTAYIRLADEEIPRGGVKRTLALRDEHGHVIEDVFMDFDHAGHLIGIEVHGAMNLIPNLIGRTGEF